MSEKIAKVYVKAIKNISNDFVKESSIAFKRVAIALENKKIVELLSSIELSKSDKLNLVLDIAKTKNPMVANTFKLLSDKNRLLMATDIAIVLEGEVSLLDNSYIGNVYSKNGISSARLKEFEDKFSKKFGSKIAFKEKKADTDMIKISIDGLGSEISFSQELFKSQIVEHVTRVF